MPTKHSVYECDWCGTRYVVASLARHCEEKHLAES